MLNIFFKSLHHYLVCTNISSSEYGSNLVSLLTEILDRVVSVKESVIIPVQSDDDVQPETPVWGSI